MKNTNGTKARKTYFPANEYLDEQTKEAILARIKDDCGGRILQVREERNISQKNMCAKFDDVLSDVTALSKIEQGRRAPSIPFLVMLHEKWGVDLNWLLCGDSKAIPDLPDDVKSAINTLERFRLSCSICN